MWVIILVIIGGILIYIIRRNTGEAIGSTGGAMRLKYSKLLNHIIDGHKDCKIIMETKTYIRVGVSNYGGATMFHIQQCPNHIVMIDYDVYDNPICDNFSLRFTFPDDMDQDIMMVQIGIGIQKKMMRL